MPAFWQRAKSWWDDIAVAIAQGRTHIDLSYAEGEYQAGPDPQSGRQRTDEHHPHTGVEAAEVVYWHGTRCLNPACGVETTTGARVPTQRNLDHVIPECDDGPTVVGNLRVLCRTCHHAKGTRRTDYRRPNWFVPPIHLAKEAGGCEHVDAATFRPAHWADGAWHPATGRRHVTTRDPFAVTCRSCKETPRMQWFAWELARHLKQQTFAEAS